MSLAATTPCVAQLRPSSLGCSAPQRHGRLVTTPQVLQQRRAARLVPRTAEPAAPAHPADTLSPAELVDFVLSKIEGTGEWGRWICSVAVGRTSRAVRKVSAVANSCSAGTITAWVFPHTSSHQLPTCHSQRALGQAAALRTLAVMLTTCSPAPPAVYATDGGDRITPADRQAVDAALARLDEIGEAKVGAHCVETSLWSSQAGLLSFPCCCASSPTAVAQSTALHLRAHR